MSRLRIQLFSAVLILFVLSLAGPAGAAEKPHRRSIPPLGAWSFSCDPAFMLAAMPDAWVFNPKEGALHIITHVAIDFERLNKDDFVVALEEGGDHDRFYDLTGYNVMALEADVRALGRRRILASIPGIYGTDRGKDPVIFSFDGRDSEGNLLPPGIYEIEVRGRFVPTWMGLSRADQPKYHDLDGWNMVAEACRRPLRIEITEKELGDRQTRGTSCAAPPATYYDSVDATNSTTLRNTLNPVIKDHTRYPYSSTGTDAWDILNDADENPSNAAELLAVYKNDAYADGCSSGCSWNREHVWAKSYGFSVESGNGRIPYTDCHHLHAANAGYNSTRSNKPFDLCPGCTTYATVANNGFGGGPGDVDKGSGGATSCGNTPTSSEIWEPWDHRKGDIARSMMYMDIRYEGITGVLGGEQDLILTDTLSQMMVETTTCGDGYQDPAYLGLLSTLITWSDNDPPDSDEQRRNDQVWCYQGNRNPFIDHPEWVDCLYLNSCSGSTTPVFGGIDSATDPDSCAATGVDIAWTTPSDWNDGCSSSCSRGFRVYRSGTAISGGGCAGVLGEATTSCTDTAGTAGTTYTYTVEAVNDVSSTSTGGTSADAADSTDDGSAPTISSGPSASSTSSTFTATWTTNEIADSYLEWGTTSGSYPNNTSDATDVTAHSLTANGLSASTTYYYRVCSTDPCGYGPTCSAEATATTAGGCTPGAGDHPVFINEFHYDNDGTDSGEMVEVAGPAGTDLTNWKIGLYNGSDGSQYDLDSLGAVIDDEGTGYGAIHITYPSNGLQNGAPDGLALIDDTGAVIQFLCYEGTFTATSGYADTMTCTDVGVSETGTTLVGDSLQLTGGPGFVYEDFSWSGPSTGSPGSLNSGQDMRCGSSGPSFGGIASATDHDSCSASGILLSWAAPTSWNDGCSSSCSRGFHVYRDGTLLTTGGCADPLAESALSCIDTTAATATSYTYRVEAFNDSGNTSDGGGTTASATDAVDATAPVISSGPTSTPSANSFDVGWSTDEASDSYLEWGISAGGPYGSSTSDSVLVVAHSLTATSLSATTTYYYRVCSTDGCGNGPTCSAEASVTTGGGACDPGSDTPVFINELHYDNTSGDQGELVEIAGPAGTDLGAGPWQILLYNGSDHKVYDTIDLSGTIDDEGSGYGALVFYPSSIQNGAPDGLALVDGSGSVVQFLSYEGAFTAADGAANGMTSTDIGVKETSSTPVGDSLQLTGGPGFVYEDFSWSGPAVDSPGSLNSGQTMECTPPPSAVPVFTARATSGQIILEWLNSSATTYSSTMIRYRTDTYPSGPADGTEIYNSGTAGAGNYDSYTHTGLTDGQNYYYAAWTVSTDAQYSSATQVSAEAFDSSAKEKWRYSSGASSLAPPGIYPGAAEVGEVLAVSNDRYLHAMKPTASGGNWPRSGGYSWNPPLMNAPASHRPPIVPLTAGPRVFLASEDGHAYSFNAHSGAQVWQSASLGSMLQANPALLSSELVSGAPDLLLIGTRESSAANTLFALDPSTGATDSAMSFTNSSAQGGDDQAMGIITGVYADYGNDYAYFTSRENSSGSNHTIWCVDLSGASVSLVWSAALGNIDAAPVLYSGRVYVGTTAGDVVALDALTGAVKWTKSTGDGAVKAFVFPRFGTSEIYFSTTNKVWGLSDNGSSYSDLWGVSTVSSPSAPVQLPGTTLLFVGGGNGTLYQLNMTNGGVDASLALSTAALGIPSADVVNSTLQVGSEDGRIHLISYPLN